MTKETKKTTNTASEYQPTLQKLYKEKVLPALLKDMGVKSPMAAPKLEKIVINIGVKEAREDHTTSTTIGKILRMSSQSTSHSRIHTSSSSKYSRSQTCSIHLYHSKSKDMFVLCVVEITRRFRYLISEEACFSCYLGGIRIQQ